MHAADVKTVLRVYSIEVAAEKKDDLNEEPIVKRLRKVRTLTAIMRSTLYKLYWLICTP